MRMLKLFVTLAGVAGVLCWSSVTVEASNCCIRDCYDYYFLMGDNGVPNDQRDPWLAECKSNCDQHGDPSACPVQGAS